METVVCCRRGEDGFVLLRFDLEDARLWGSRQELTGGGIAVEVLDLAEAGSATVSDPPTPGAYPWSVEDVQDGDWLVDRARADEYCAERGADDDPDLADFHVGSVDDGRRD